MKLATYLHQGIIAPGVVIGDRIVPFAMIAPDLPGTLEALLDAGPDALAALRARLPDDTADDMAAAAGLPLAAVELRAPIRHPRKFLAIGLNYASHLEEFLAKGNAAPDLAHQIWFNKQTSCITGPFAPIHRPHVSEQLDFEGELGIVIGRRCRHVAAADARHVIAGYLIVNDVSVRDWQKRTPTATLGKSFDTHGPTGPWLTTADEIADPERLAIVTTVDGTVMQRGNTAEFLKTIGEMIAYLTTVMTLEPGDILATGTPSGVGMGRTPPRWLVPGQSVRVAIEGLGHIENRVIEEPVASKLHNPPLQGEVAREA